MAQTAATPRGWGGYCTTTTWDSRLLLLGLVLLSASILILLASEGGGALGRRSALFDESLRSAFGSRAPGPDASASEVANPDDPPEGEQDEKGEHNPYPFYPWWPEFNKLIMEADATKGTKSGELRHGDTVSKESVTELLFKLSDFVALNETPESPYEVTTRPTPLTFDCGSPEYSAFLTGARRDQAVKVAWGFQFAGEVPLLDIALHEQDGVVDHFVIYESTSTHRDVRKPLFFERHKMRYTRFMDRIVHLVADDGHVPVSSFGDPIRQGGVAGLDSKDHSLLTRKAQHLTDILSGDDFFVMGDLDEIPDYKFLYHLKNCEVKEDNLFPAYSNVMFFVNDFRYLFKGDHPPSFEYPYSHKHPVIYTYKGLNETQNARNFKLRVQAVPPLGGYHLSAPPFIPALVSKFFGGTGYGGGPLTNNMTEWFEMYRNGDSIKKFGWEKRVVDPVGPKAPSAYKEAFHLPWLVEQNKHKFPFLFLGEPTTIY